MSTLKKETLDELLDRLTQECLEERKRLNTISDGTEQFTELVEKYHRKAYYDEAR